MEFVGREGELGRLDDRLARALAGSGSAVFLSAEAGAGKSTLVDHFLARVGSGQPDVLVLRAGCSEQYGAGEPYQPFVEAFRGLVIGSASSGQKKSFRQLAKEIAPYWISAIPVAGEAIAAGLATAGHLKHAFGTGSGAAAPSQEALFFQYTELFFAAADERPLLLFIDDLHWADTASVGLLTHLARQIVDRRILILGSYRPVDVDVSRHAMGDARRELERYKVAEEITLAPLGSEALAEFVRLRTGSPPDAELLDWLERRAGTNALFFEGLLAWLLDQNLIGNRKGVSVLSRRPDDVEIPRSAEATIEKRLERLDEDTYRVVEYASVDGNEFDSVTLSKLLDMDELELEERLEPIAKTHRLIRLQDTVDLPNGDIASVYEFSHSLVQDVLHRGIQGKRRILLHRKIAQVLEDIYGEKKVGVAHKLAVHFEEGRLAERAFEFAIMAADAASRLYAHWDAIDQLNRALRNAEGDRPTFEAWHRLGSQYYYVGRYPESLEAFDEALSHGGDSEPLAVLRTRRLRLLAERDHGKRPVDEILADLKHLRDEAKASGASAELCEIIWQVIVHPGTPATLDIELAEDALTIANELGDEALVARGEAVLGTALTFTERIGEAAPHVERALATYQKLEERENEGNCLNQLAAIAMMTGDSGAAAIGFEKAMRVYDEIIAPSKSVMARNNAGLVLYRRGDYDRAREVLTEAVEMGRRVEAGAHLLPPLQNLAEVHQARGELDESATRWTELLELAHSLGLTAEEIIAQCGLGLLCLQRDDLPGALAAERAARALVTTPEWDESRELLELLAAKIAAATGEPMGAAGMLEAAETELEKRDKYMWGAFRLERARIMVAVDATEARDLARSAHEALQEVDAAALAEQAHALVEALMEPI